MVANPETDSKPFRFGTTELGRCEECCYLPLRLPKSYFRHNRHYCAVYHSCTDESVLPTDTSDTVLRGSTANWRNCRNWNRRFPFACKALKYRVLSAKCRIHRDLQIMAVIESFPLRHYFCCRHLAGFDSIFDSIFST
jgi:hypothetical protein